MGYRMFMHTLGSTGKAAGKDIGKLIGHTLKLQYCHCLTEQYVNVVIKN